MNQFLSNINVFFTTQRSNIIQAFKVLYLSLVVLIIVSIFLLRGNDDLVLFLFDAGKLFGDSALIAYLLTLLPGIGERLSIKNNVLSILRIYRRYIGILMFILAVTHLLFIKLIYVHSLAEAIPQVLFEGMGVLAIFFSFILFLISNNTSLGKLRIWWYRIQRLTYIIMFFIFLHVALVGVSVWSILMGSIIILQLISFCVVYKNTHSLTGGRPL